MSETLRGPEREAIRPETRGPAGLGAAAWLGLAAAPTFAVMAVLTYVHGGGQMAAMCQPAGGASVFSGMVPMYLLMSAFHSPPWLKLIAGRRGMRRSRR